MDEILRRLERAARAGDLDAAAKLEVASYRIKRDAWRVSPMSMARALTRGHRRPYQRAKHLELLSDALRDAAHKPDQRIIVSMPPRHGKTELTSIWNPVWFLDRYPEANVGVVGYAQKFAEKKYGLPAMRRAREHAGSLRFRLAKDLQQAKHWGTTAGGAMFTTGIGGELTGWGLNLAIVDDFFKNAKDAYSDVKRDDLWDWWVSVLMTRLEPGCSVVVVATRWHEDDLVGRLLRDEPGEWRVLSFPAIATEHDELGRAPGDALWPERWSLRSLERKRKSKGMTVWVFSALYQQDPQPAAGGLFQAAWLRTYHFVVDRIARGTSLLDRFVELVPKPGAHPMRYRLRDLVRFGTVDLATSEKEEADETVAAAWALTPDRYLICLEVFALHATGGQHVGVFHEVQERWDLAGVWIEESGMQLAIVQQAQKAKLRVRSFKPDRDKVARAIFSTTWLEPGRVFFDAGADWWSAFRKQLLSFPKGAHDDQVDAFTSACFVAESLAVAQPLPPPADDPDDDLDDPRDAGPSDLLRWGTTQEDDDLWGTR